MKLARKPKVGMISLGCAKNLVDAEMMLGSVLQRGMEITSRPEDADVLVVNTCAFIDSAKEESIEAILEAHQQRGLNRRPNQKLIVSGCMSQRFAKELRREMPEVDAFIGLDQVARAWRNCGKNFKKTPNAQRRTPNLRRRKFGYWAWDVRRWTFLLETARSIWHSPTRGPPTFPITIRRASGLHRRIFAYVKIAEGCNHPCSFCVIPQMRGKHRSRLPESVLAEIRALVQEGVREINLISQDTTYYGMDLWQQQSGTTSAS